MEATCFNPWEINGAPWALILETSAPENTGLGLVRGIHYNVIDQIAYQKLLIEKNASLAIKGGSVKKKRRTKKKHTNRKLTATRKR